ncbi:MAG: serine/threonine protein phosphatase [Acetobacteraceae bacterium]|nr:serine/threonine protein phosphatase [Acetobacteraceae bacterium]
MLEFVPAPAVLPPGRRVYAVGDIHGCAAQMDALHGQIAEDLAHRPVPEPVLVHIGDYVDRGPDTDKVVGRLAHGPPIPGVQVVNLLGNHEHTMLAALGGDRAAATDWLYQGGRETLMSYDLNPDGLRETWAGAVPRHHLAWLLRLTLWHREGGYLFAHAGIRPGVPLHSQAVDDLLRIRQPFLYTDRELGAVVVHGHTPVREVTIRRNRIAIDTGAVFGGRLSCVVLEGAAAGVLAV